MANESLIDIAHEPSTENSLKGSPLLIDFVATRSPLPQAECSSLPSEQLQQRTDNEDLADSTQQSAPINSLIKDTAACFQISGDSCPTFDLNQTAQINAVILEETLPDLALKSSIINDGVISKSMFVDAQNLDPKIASLKQSVRPGKIAVKIIDDVACKRVKGKYLPILPKCLETMLLYSEHFHVLAGHRSATTIIQSISEKFYMFDIKQKVTQFCKNCYICSVAKSLKMRKATQGETKKAKEPREILSFDIFGGLNTSEDGYKYVYSFVDNFSLFVVNVKAKTKTTPELLSAFLHVFAIWGRFPSIVCSDNESGLMNKEASDFFASFGITHNPGASHAHWRLLSEGSSTRAC